jgi:hypothetical protein
MHDPILMFQLIPLSIFYLGFLESIEWVKANANAKA